MKRAAITLLLLLLPLSFGENEPPPQEPEELRMILNELDLSDWDRWFLASDPEIEFVPSDFLTQAVSEGTVRDATDWIDLFQKRMHLAWSPVGRKFAVFLGFGILTALLGALQMDGAIGIPDAAIRLLGGCTVLSLVAPTLQDAAAILERLNDGAQVLLPVLLGFFALFDFSATGAVFSSGVALLSECVIRIGTGLVFPLALIGCVLHALDGFGEERLGSLARICHRSGRWLLRIGSSLYLTVTAVRGSVAVHADTLLFRTAKLAAGSLPFVGGLVSGSADTLYACMQLVRSTLGWTGILTLGGAVLGPMIRLLLEQMALRLCAACVLPIGCKSYAALLNRAADMLELVLITVVVTFLMIAGTVGLVMGIWQGL